MKKFIGILIALLTTTTLTACQSNTTQNRDKQRNRKYTNNWF